ncbi:hypothetical protein [Halalkalicoccus ordinarius]|uniref:hypothetical protein n=1 Tax=Halalkalicoccus ordinarius TaxID=3116651 RepID=UPI00300F2E93
MARNTIMGLVGLLSAALLVTAAIGTYRLFSYLAALLILGTIATASIETNEREWSLAPYTGMIAGLTAVFLIGLTGIWLLWDPNAAEITYDSYVLGVPVSTFVYFLFLWLLPPVGAIYYSLIFDRIGSEEIVDSILEDAREAQQGANLPLTPERVERTTDMEVEADD